MEILARAVGRRKEAVAQVQLVRGNGQFLINNKPAQAYLQNNSCSLICIKSPLEAALSLFSNNLIIPDSLNSISFPFGEPEGVAALPSEGTENAKEDGASLVEQQGLTEKSIAPLAGSSPLLTNVKGDQTGEAEDLFNSLPQLEKEPGAATNLTLIQPNTDLKSEEGVFNWGARQGEIDIIVKVKGGGLIGQAEAIKLAVARAFCIMENVHGGASLRKILKTKGYLTQDSRVKERKKYGLKKARKASQYHKR